MSDESEKKVEKIEFKKKMRNKPLRKRQRDSEGSGNEEDTSVRNKVEEMKTIQKSRQRPYGVNVIGLALGEEVTAESANSSDPFNTKSGGMVNMKSLKNAKSNQDRCIGTQFNAETNKRDEDQVMGKYIEEELSKRKNTTSHDTSSGLSGGRNYCSPEEAALQAVPEYLRQSSGHRSEEMLSNQLLSGIPEVDLGIDAKIKNIEATEEAKQKLLWNRHRKNDGPSQFVPTNMAVNFVQHNRFDIDDGKAKNVRARAKKTHPKENSKGKKKEGSEKATDDYYYERFRKQFRR